MNGIVVQNRHRFRGGVVRVLSTAEAFNSKVKIFRSQMRGVRDRDFFILRLVKLYA